MNNPPNHRAGRSRDGALRATITRCSKHVRGYLIVGATLLIFTGLTVALSYVNFGTQKANVAVAMVVATFKAGLVASIFMHFRRRRS